MVCLGVCLPARSLLAASLVAYGAGYASPTAFLYLPVLNWWAMLTRKVDAAASIT